MALPVPKTDSDGTRASSRPRGIERTPQEGLFRPVVREDGSTAVEQVPLTREALLNPQEEELLSQNRPHQLALAALIEVLPHYFKERGSEYSVYSELLILWKRLGERDVAPDFFVAKGVRNPKAVRGSFDPVALGVGPCLVFEIVSSSSRDMEEKDLLENPPLYARRGVEDLVLIHPADEEQPEEQPMRLDVRRLTPEKKYRPNLPDEDGWILLRSVGLRIRVSDDGAELLLEDARTGQRLRRLSEEVAVRRQAEEKVQHAQEKERRAVEARRRETEARLAVEDKARREREARQREEEARREAEQRLAQALEEIERLRSQLGD